MLKIGIINGPNLNMLGKRDQNACIGQITGFGYASYILAIHALQDLLEKKAKKIK